MLTSIINFLRFLGNWNYVWWIPLLILGCVIHSWISKQNNEIGGSKWLLFTFLWGAIWQVWALVSLLSKRLVFDAMLYDNILFLSYAVTLVILGGGHKFTSVNWLGFGLIIMGSILMRLTWAWR